MRKRVMGRQLSRESSSRQALFVSLMATFVRNGVMKTTISKAKAVQGDIDGLVVLAKKGNLSSQRKLMSLLRNDNKAVDALAKKAKDAFAKRNSGFTRILRLGPRLGDSAEMVRMEWVESNENIPTKVKPSK